MKKILTVGVLVLTMISTMVGCGNKTKVVEEKLLAYCMECTIESNNKDEFCKNCGAKGNWSDEIVTKEEIETEPVEEVVEEEPVVEEPIVEEEPVVEQVLAEAPVAKLLYTIDGIYDVYDGDVDYINSQTNNYLSTIPKNPDGCYSENGQCFAFQGTIQWTRTYLCVECHNVSYSEGLVCQDCLDMQAEEEWFESVGTCTSCGYKLNQDYSGVGDKHDSCQ